MPSDTGTERIAPSGFEVVHARMLHRFADLVRMQGGDPHALLLRAGMSDDRQCVTYRETSRLLELAAQRLECPDFGMRLAHLQGGGLVGHLGDAMRSSKTFGDAIRYACEHSYAHSPAARIVYNPIPDDDRIFVSHDLLLDGIVYPAQLMEQIILLGNLFAIQMTNGSARAWRVHFRHEALSPIGTYRSYFGCDVRFGQPQDGVIYAPASLVSPVVRHDAEAHRGATAVINACFAPQTAPFHAQVRWLIMHRLGKGDCSYEGIAAELKVHPRTLHRRLAAERSSFQRIKDAVRRDHMLYYLQHTEMDLAEISERIGFAEQSVLTRSCQRWLGASPRSIRAHTRRWDGAASPAASSKSSAILHGCGAE